MSETKFTSGKWRKTTTESGLPKIIDDKGFAICHGRDYSKTANANFDLMVAAPAMYAKLQEIAESMDKFGFERTATEIYSLLATARGEANQSNPQQ